MGNLQPRAKLIWSLTASGKGTTLSAGGNSGSWAGSGPGDWPPALNAETPVDLREITDVVLMVSVGAIASSPSLQVGLDVYDNLGNLFANVLQTAAITSAVNTVPVLAGGLHGGYNGTASSYLVLPEWGRVSWTLSGGSMTGVQIALYGR
jgi:hypothetical protein